MSIDGVTVTDAACDELAWRAILDLAAADDGGAAPDGPLAALFGPLLDAGTEGCVVAHLGQSLDGRIALPDGRSHYVTGRADAVHNHRLRALSDAVIVGASTVAMDDPQLTVRHVAGDNPVRVVIDPLCRLDPELNVFCDGQADTLVVCAVDAASAADRHGDARLVALPRGADGLLAPRDIVDALAALGLTTLFVEGGGVTVSRFVEAALVDRLHVTVAPLLLGDGLPVLTLAAIERVDAARRVAMRPYLLGDDLLYDCVLHDRAG